MTISKHIKVIHFVIIVFTLLFFAGIQSVDAAVNGTNASFTVRDYGVAGLFVDDTDDASGYYGWVQDFGFITEHFFEFDISALDSSHIASLNIDLRNNTSINPTHGFSHDVTLAYYSGTGSSDSALFGTGTFLQTFTLPNTGINRYSIDVTSIFSSFRGSGNDYLGFRLYDAVWNDDKSGDQLQYVDSTLTTAIVPEPVSTTLFIIGGVVLGGRSYLRRKRNK